MTYSRDLELVLSSYFPIVTIESHEERRALDLLREAAAKTSKDLYAWTVTDGLKKLANAGRAIFDQINVDQLTLEPLPSGPVRESAEQRAADPAEALRQVKKAYTHSVIVLLDFHPYMEEPKVVRLLKEIAIDSPTTGMSLVMLSHELSLPEELKHFSTRFDIMLPDTAALETLVKDEAAIWASKHGKPVRTDAEVWKRLIRNLRGLTLSDARRVVRNAIYDDGVLDEADLVRVMRSKYQLLGGDDVLSFEHDIAQMSDIGGFGALKRWLEIRRHAFLREEGVDLEAPKGILLLGIQGGGKSLAAKAVAGTWGVPLIRLDFGRLYNKFFGETERNIRSALKTAEVMAPCVLWMDEIEKGIATGDNDNGTSRRILATLLTWMAENRQPVFVVATANDIQSLPPELMRKGRMDEIFFVDLPDNVTRAEIFAIHLRKRGRAPEDFDLQQLADATEGYSGAEIEQAVIGSLYAAHGRPLHEEDILAETRRTKPLSVVMAEQVGALRRWAEGRTVSASL